MNPLLGRLQPYPFEKLRALLDGVTPIDDAVFARELARQYNVRVLPGSYLARDAHGVNPGRNHVRIALVAPPDECVEAMQRIGQFARHL